MASPSLPHIVIFPFMSKGHTIPLINLGRLLHQRRLATLTFFTTPRNSPFIRSSLADTEASIIELPFPDEFPGLPAGVESTDHLPSMSLFLPFVQATKQLQPHFEQILDSLPLVSFMISDGFHSWTLESASKFGIPRLVFYGMGAYALTVSAVLKTSRPHAAVCSDTEPFLLPGFPHIQLTKAEVGPPFNDPNPQGPEHDFHVETGKADAGSQGMIFNTFYEMEATYFEYCKHRFQYSAWCVGPLCLAEPKCLQPLQPEILRWLDSRSAVNRPVLYVAFGSQAKISSAQLQEIAVGLEKSGVDFLWVVKSKEWAGIEEFKERVGDGGMVVGEWVAQTEILKHQSVKGFMSHCGWNSVLESICAGVPILAWPMMFDQPFNAKLVVEELGVGLKILTGDGTLKGLVSNSVIEGMVRELVLGEKGKKVAKKVMELGEAARKAVEGGGGSSWRSLELMINEVSRK